MDEKLVVEITAEIKDLEQNLNKAQKEIGDFGKKGKTSFDDFQKSFSKVGDVAKKSLAVVATAIAGTATALMALSASTQEYRQSQAKLTSAFDQAGFSANTAKDVYTDLYKVIGDSDVAVEASQQIALLAKSDAEVAKWGELASGVMATFGDALQPETFYEAANETLKLGEATGGYAQMLEQAGYNVDDFNEKLQACGTEQEKSNLLWETAYDIMGDAGKAYDEATASIQANREAHAKLDETLASIGETMEPVNTAFTQLLNDCLVQLQPYLEEFASTYIPQIVEALGDMGTKIGEVISWIADNWEIISTIGTIILGVATAITVVSTALSVYSTIMTIVNTVTLPVIGTIGAVIAIITALVAIIVLAIQHWDELKEVASKVADAIKEAVSKMVDKVTQFFTNLWSKITSTVENIKTSVVNKFNDIKDKASNSISNLKDNISNAFTNIKSTITDKINGAKTSCVNSFNSIKSNITSILDNAKNVVKNSLETMKGFFNFSWSLPHIKLPHFSISGSFSLNPPSIPHFSVSWYQKGGVFDNPMLFGYGNGQIGGLGENGAEAIVPLEKNTQWLDKIAEKLYSKQGNTPIVLEVDGTTFAKTSIKSINDLTRQTGRLPLKLV